MNQSKLKMWHIRMLATIYTVIASLILVSAASAHDAPPGDEYQMADWMLFSFLLFFGIAFIVFLVALKRGLMRHPEDAKYYLFDVNEPDYYTPAWALETETDNPSQQGTQFEKKGKEEKP